MKKIITTILFLIIQIISYSFEDNYIFNAERIKRVFSEWELVDEEKKENHYMQFINREKDITIDISTYKKGDNPEIAEKRFLKILVEDGYKINGNGHLSVKYLGTASKEFRKYSKTGIRKKENFFFEKVKFAIFHTDSEEDYKETLELVKEAIDPSMKIKERPKKVFKKPIEINKIFDVKKLKREFDNTHKFVEFKYNTSPSGIMIFLDEEKVGLRRQIIIESNDNFSKKVMMKRRDYDLQFSEEQGYKYTGEDKKSEKYFGVTSKDIKIHTLKMKSF